MLESQVYLTTIRIYLILDNSIHYIKVLITTCCFILVKTGI